MLSLREKMRVGPKGQVVIPKGIRDAEQIYPGTDVIFETTDHGIHIQKAGPDRDPIEVFREIAFSINKVPPKNIKLHGYEEQIDKRLQRALKNRKVHKE